MRKHEGWPSVLLGRDSPQTMLSRLLARSLQRHCGGGEVLACGQAPLPPLPGVHYACLSGPPLCGLVLSSLQQQSDLYLSCLEREWPVTTCTYTRPFHSLRKFKWKRLSYIPPPIRLHLPCPQSLSNWDRFLEWKLCDKLWPNHKTQRELKVTK